MTPENAVVRSYAEANKELVAAFCRYLIGARGLSPSTVRAYNGTMQRFIEFLGSASVIEADRSVLRDFLGRFVSRGLSAASSHIHMNGLKAFYKFVQIAGETNYDPTFRLSHRKIPFRLPVVLSVEECERLIEAARNPFERAVVEVLYATGVRVSELVNLRLDDIKWATDESQPNSIRVNRGKGNKDRIVLFGCRAAEAIRAYQKFRPSMAGFLFEAPANSGSLRRLNGSWHGRFYVDKVQRSVAILPDTATPYQARRELDRLTSRIPGFVFVPRRQYTARAIRLVLKTMGYRAGLGRVHPHALRRAFASHLLQRGLNLREVQELMGHKDIGATVIYTHLTAQDLKAAYDKAHPHAQGDADDEKK